MVFCLIDNKNWMVVVIWFVFIYFGGFLGVMGFVFYMFNW